MDSVVGFLVVRNIFIQVPKNIVKTPLPDLARAYYDETEVPSVANEMNCCTEFKYCFLYHHKPLHFSSYYKSLALVIHLSVILAVYFSQFNLLYSFRYFPPLPCNHTTAGSLNQHALSAYASPGETPDSLNAKRNK